MKKKLFAMMLTTLLGVVLGICVFAAGEDATLSSRLWDFWVTYHTEIVSAVGSGIVLCTTAYFKYRDGKKTKGFLSSQNAVVDVVNTLIDNYNEVKDTQSKGNAEYAKLLEAMSGIMIYDTTVMEMLNAVYTNSKNLPQGVKDELHIRRASCMKAIEGSSLCKGIYDLIQTELGVSANEETNEG